METLSIGASFNTTPCKSKTHSAANSRTTFLDLPTELRQQILRYTMIDDYIHNHIWTSLNPEDSCRQVWVFRPRTMQNWTRRLSKLHPVTAHDME
jgi:hypothetical protein